MIVFRILVIVGVFALVMIGLKYAVEIEHAFLNENKPESLHSNIDMKAEREKLMREVEKQLEQFKEKQAY